MPKIKTSRSAQKRFKKTPTGLFLYKRAFKGHLLGHKSSKRKRFLSQRMVVRSGDAKALKSMLPYL
jgi:large subunit ribosomal protein L35